MANKFQLSVVTPNGTFYEGEADRMNIKTTNGYMGVLHGHVPLVGTVEISKLEIIDGKNRTVAAISGGLLYVEKEKTLVISDAIELIADIDHSRAKQALERAQKRVASKSDDVDLKRAELALARAQNRIAQKK